VFRIPKPEASFDASLEQLFATVSPKFSPAGKPLQWREFYPVAKSFIAQKLRYSLVATYQNKYTLHRSLTTAAAVLFWVSLLGIAAGLVAPWKAAAEPHYGALASLATMSVIVIWGFSDSYMFHWKMFGNTIVTESYAMLLGPKDDGKTDQEPSTS
jgi:hypothetical protein